jgi:MFS family permease
MNPRTLFIASCIALITSAFTFVIRGDILPDLGREFSLTQEQLGWIAGGAFWGMAVAMLLGAPICDFLGMKLILCLAFACHMIGVFGTIFAPHDHTAFMILFISTFLAGCGNGLVEIAINPLAATLYPNQKTHYLNVLHAWWPGGLMLGGLIARGLAYLINKGSLALPEGLTSWQLRMGLIVVPGVLYFLMVLTQRFPQTERVASGVSTGEMFKEVLRPLFLIWAFCMLLTAATELGPQQWQESVITRTTDGRVSGTMILVYTSSMMFILRHFAGALVHAFSPVGLLMGSSVLAGIGLYLLSFADSPATAFGYATIFGLGIAYFWPTMLGVTAERFPKGGALLLGLMGSVGNLSIALVLPFMGYMYDKYTVAAVPTEYVAQVVNDDRANWALQLVGIETVKKLNPDAVANLPAEGQQAIQRAEASGAAMAFRVVSALPILLVLIFGAIAIRDKLIGGYKPEIILSRDTERELFAGGVQAPVE